MARGSLATAAGTVVNFLVVYALVLVQNLHVNLLLRCNHKHIFVVLLGFQVDVCKRLLKPVLALVFVFFFRLRCPKSYHSGFICRSTRHSFLGEHGNVIHGSVESHRLIGCLRTLVLAHCRVEERGHFRLLWSVCHHGAPWTLWRLGEHRFDVGAIRLHRLVRVPVEADKSLVVSVA